METMMDNYEDDFLGRLDETWDETDRQRIGTLQRVHDNYLETRRDGELAKQLKFLVEASLRTHDGRRAEGRALVVIGKSGAGKSWAVDRAVRIRPEFEPVGDLCPFLSLTAPSPCTLKQLGREFLRQLGYPLERELKEHMVWEKVRERLKLRRVRFVWIDEMHHAMRGTDVQKLRDTLKNVMQQEDWPVSFILSGLPTLVDFLVGDFQFQRRKRVVRFRDLEFPRHCNVVRWVIKQVVQEHAKMKPVDGLVTDEFLNRLNHASCGRFGMVVTFVRGAIEEVLEENSTAASVALKHFAAVYASLTGCDDPENVFTAEKWHELDPEPLLFREDVEEPSADEKPAKTGAAGRRK
jgi:hypothetical protein